MILATSSLQGLLAAMQLIGYLLTLCIVTSIALFIYVAIVTFKLGRQDAGANKSRTSRPKRARSDSPQIQSGPGASSPTFGSPTGARRSMR